MFYIAYCEDGDITKKEFQKLKGALEFVVDRIHVCKSIEGIIIIAMDGDSAQHFERMALSKHVLEDILVETGALKYLQKDIVNIEYNRAKEGYYSTKVEGNKFYDTELNFS